jgi:hypothetical protein
MPPKGYEERCLTLYFTSPAEVKEIHQAAEKAKVPYATFCREMIRRGMEQSQKQDTARNGNEIREELAKAKMGLARQEERIAQLEAELFAARHSAFLSYPSGSGQGSVSDELVDLLKSGGSWRSDAIMKVLGIDPKNIDAIRALAGQLRALQDLKLVIEGHNGWRWANE